MRHTFEEGVNYPALAARLSNSYEIVNMTYTEVIGHDASQMVFCESGHFAQAPELVRDKILSNIADIEPRDLDPIKRGKFYKAMDAEDNILFVFEYAKEEKALLTLAAARKLKGKKIRYSYRGYNGYSEGEMVVGDIVSDYDLAAREPYKGYASRAEYWESFMTAEKLQDTKDELVLLDEKGENNHFLTCFAGTKYQFFEEATFTCSDADIPVYYEEIG